jgi:two-component system sensor histidine kinase PilS (NtrC family)
MSPQLGTRLRWVIGIRLVMITSVALPYFLLQLARPEAALPAAGEPMPPIAIAAAGHPEGRHLYFLAGVTYLASLFYIALLRLLPRRPEVQAYFQFIGDLLLISALVYYFGGIASPFSMLYLIVIAVAAALLRRRAGIRVATMAYALYSALLLALYFGWLSPPASAIAESYSIFRLAYNLAVHFFGFYAVALLTDFLAEDARRAERRLEEKMGDLADLQVVHRDVVQSISSGLVTCDHEGTITSVNRAAGEILGRSPESLPGTPLAACGLFDDDEWRRLVSETDAGARVRREVDYRRDQREIHVGFSLGHLTDAEGRGRGYILIFQDLTDLRRLQEEVRLKDRMAAVGELAAGIAHEIGNPLAAISGSVQMLAASPERDSSQRKLLEIVLKESQRLDRTIKGFLQFARPKERAAVRCDVARLLAENFALLYNSAEVSSRHRLEIALDPPSAVIVADPDQLSQIFWNLARNALRAMPDGGTLEIAGRLDGAVYRFEVIDSGRGMSEEERAKLFQPFKSFFGGGTGVGMAIVYRIVQEHGGRLAVASRPGGGSRITVELPVSSPPTAAASAASLAARARS